jgi:hypothetical protein
LTNKPLFKPEFLNHYLQNFRLSDIVNIYQIKKTINKWIEAEESGKLQSLKEEVIRSQFLTRIFGDVLGFNYNNNNNWLLQEEVKTDVDGTKPDATLGTFSISDNGVHNEVRIVIEAKGVGGNLDEKQKRTGFNGSPVEQAMLYATKMRGNCRWVVVTNLQEIRFYQANDQSRYQRYFLNDLKDEEALKELLFLFHRDRFYKGTQSATERLVKVRQTQIHESDSQQHIIDQLYKSLRRFVQLTFIDPRHLANLKPFNILDEYVWHYRDWHLFTLKSRYLHTSESHEFRASANCPRCCL